MGVLQVSEARTPMVDNATLRAEGRRYMTKIKKIPIPTQIFAVAVKAVLDAPDEESRWDHQLRGRLVIDALREAGLLSDCEDDWLLPILYRLSALDQVLIQLTPEEWRDLIEGDEGDVEARRQRLYAWAASEPMSVVVPDRRRTLAFDFGGFRKALALPSSPAT